MLIGKVLDKADVNSTWDIAADKLADKVRNIWLDKRAQKAEVWEESFTEERTVIALMREEGMPGLTNVEYIFKWWGNPDSEDLAGELDVIWSLNGENGSEFYCTWIKFADRDFIVGFANSEADRREITRGCFREAFSTWRTLLEKV